MLSFFYAIRQYLSRSGFGRLIYKTVPHIYHRHPAEEDLYALFRAAGRLYRVDLLSVIDAGARLPFQERRRRRIKLAERAGLRTMRSRDFAGFWPILEENLRAVHATLPVHTVEEITLLHARFPDLICLHLCLEGDSIVAGIVVYDTDRVAHAQYIAASERGKEVGALDLLIADLIEREYAHRAYFDLGISNEDEGLVLNTGLVEQKEGFGARGVAHQFFELGVA
jgi:hypothetical protein